MSGLNSSDCIQTNNASVPISASKTIMSICKESLLMINSKNRVAFDSILRIKVNCRKDSDIQYSSRICKTGEQKNHIFEYLNKSKYLFIQELVFAILVADNQLVTMVRPKKFSLHPSGISVNFPQTTCYDPKKLDYIQHECCMEYFVKTNCSGY